MIIDQAIEILRELPNNVNTVLDYDQQDALKLGIEALKAIAKMRHYPFPDEILLLPGETKD